MDEYIQEIAEFNEKKWTIELLELLFNRSEIAKKFGQEESEKEFTIMVIENYNDVIKQLLKLESSWIINKK